MEAIELTILEHPEAPAPSRRHRFMITVEDGRAEIRRASEPVTERDTSASILVGVQPMFTALELRVEAK